MTKVRRLLLQVKVQPPVLEKVTRPRLDIALWSWRVTTVLKLLLQVKLILPTDVCERTP